MTNVAATAIGLLGERPDAIAARAQSRRYLMLLLPPMFLLVGLFVYPVVNMLISSIYDGGLSSDQYVRIFSDSIYFRVFLITLRVALLTTLICLVVGYPLAYVILGLPRRLQVIAIMLVVLPFFISLIVRTYAGMVLLGRRGLVNGALQNLGLDEPVQLMHSSTGALIGMAYALLPFMVLTCLGVMRSIDDRYLHAAYSLGATRLQAFLRIFLPLSIPGVLGGTILVFIMSLGFFITPRLMGGSSDIMVAMLIANEVEITLNWPFAAALSTILLVLTLVGFVLFARLVKLETMFEAKS